MVCLQVMFLSPCPSKSLSLPVVMDTLMGKIGCTPILSVKVSVKKIKGAAHKNGDIDGIFTQNLHSLKLYVKQFAGQRQHHS